MILNLPEWLNNYFKEEQNKFKESCSMESKMQVAIKAARLNVENETGGPFGAAIFKGDKLISVGVNLVVRNKQCILHAEVVAMILAQNVFFAYELKGCELFTSVEPCTMCLGASYWAGFDKIVCGATDEDARNIGFDEGEKPENWQKRFRSKGIQIVENVLQKESIEVLNLYKSKGGIIY